ncbi:MAG: hypothetical protein ACP6IP_08250 [Candidatus Njordarchaeia archaeon]
MEREELLRFLQLLDEYKKIRKNLFDQGFLDESFILTELEVLNTLRKLSQLQMELKTLFPENKLIWNKICEAKNLVSRELKKLYEPFGYEDLLDELLKTLNLVFEFEITTKLAFPLFDLDEETEHINALEDGSPIGERNRWEYT